MLVINPINTFASTCKGVSFLVFYIFVFKFIELEFKINAEVIHIITIEVGHLDIGNSVFPKITTNRFQYVSNK